MSKELRKKAEKAVKAKLSLYTTAIVFSCTTAILLILSLYLPQIAVWLLLPVPAFIMILGVLYLEAFGFSFKKGASENWRDEEIAKEMARLSRQNSTPLPDLDESPASEQLELKKFEPLERMAGDEDYV